jgi:serine O-acetyltransferase
MSLPKRQALNNFVDAVRADYGSVQRYREKYHGQKVPMARMPLDFVRKVGFQTLTVVRVMTLLRDLGVPVAPQIVSRMIRHLYSSEIHWDATIAPGVSIVHGVGLVISHAATVGEGCILFHNVTLGEGIDPETRAVGAPTLESDVHIGPGATLIGPITVGKGTKIMAGSVLTRSVPPGSLVAPAEAQVTERSNKKKQ